LATEHELVSRLVSETLKTDWLGYTDLDLNLIEPGRTILQAEPEARCPYRDGIGRECGPLRQSYQESEGAFKRRDGTD